MPVNNVFAVVPAAGRGRRFGGDTAKQFLQLGRQTVLEHTLEALLSVAAIQRVVVALPEDELSILDTSNERLHGCVGGDQRADSVRLALAQLASWASRDDLVMVHDAARPCLTQDDIESLLHAAQRSNDGALLALPITDTVKRASDAGQVECTVDRSGLWRALTPQCFRYGLLVDALAANNDVTDESSAMEAMGFAPQLVPGSADNIKITRREDLVVAQESLRQQGRL